MKLSLVVNGAEHEVEAHPLVSLLDVLREQCGLTGSKYGCGEGECGACSVIVNDELVMGCLLPAVQADGARIETVEGLAAIGPGGAPCLHPVQESFHEHGGAQCGICTPGMLMASVYYLRHPERAPGGEREALAGNLCRCTGYSAIFRSLEDAKKKLAQQGADV